MNTNSLEKYNHISKFPQMENYICLIPEIECMILNYLNL